MATLSNHEKAQRVRDIVESLGGSVLGYSGYGHGSGSYYMRVEHPNSDEVFTIRFADHAPPKGRGGYATDAAGSIIKEHSEADLSFHPGALTLPGARKALQRLFGMKAGSVEKGKAAFIRRWEKDRKQYLRTTRDTQQIVDEKYPPGITAEKAWETSRKNPAMSSAQRAFQERRRRILQERWPGMRYAVASPGYDAFEADLAVTPTLQEAKLEAKYWSSPENFPLVYLWDLRTGRMHSSWRGGKQKLVKATKRNPRKRNTTMNDRVTVEETYKTGRGYGVIVSESGKMRGPYIITAVVGDGGPKRSKAERLLEARAKLRRKLGPLRKAANPGEVVQACNPHGGHSVSGNPSNYASAAARIRSAKTESEIARIEKSLERVYNAGQLSVSEYSRLDGLLMDQKAKVVDGVVRGRNSAANPLPRGLTDLYEEALNIGRELGTAHVRKGKRMPTRPGLDKMAKDATAKAKRRAARGAHIMPVDRAIAEAKFKVGFKEGYEGGGAVRNSNPAVRTAGNPTAERLGLSTADLRKIIKIWDSYIKGYPKYDRRGASHDLRRYLDTYRFFHEDGTPYQQWEGRAQAEDLPVEVLWHYVKPMVGSGIGFSITKDPRWNKLDVYYRGQRHFNDNALREMERILTQLDTYGYITFLAAGSVWEITPADKQVGRGINPSMRRNPSGGSMREADSLYESFHGKAPTRTTRIITKTKARTDYAELGPLVELKIHLLTGEKHKLNFPPDGRDAIMLCSDPSGQQLYFIGGNQEVDLREIGMSGSPWEKDQMVLGVLEMVTYRTEKGFDNFQLTDYYHELGEESGMQPLLVYDNLNQLLSVAGGQYEVRPEGIVN